MALFTWKDDYSVKIEKIDGQHKKLVDLLNSLHSSMLSAKADDVLGKVLDELADYTAIHFKTEEDLMKSYSYEGYKSHKEAHDSFVSKVLEFSKEFKSGRKMISVELLYFLKDWLVSHINGVDKLYIDFFHSKGIK